MVPSVSWTFNLYPSILSLLCLVSGVLAPLLRICSISHIILESVSGEATVPRLIDTPFQILERLPHRFVSALSLDSGLQHLAHVEEVLRKLYGIFVVDQLLLVRPLVRVPGWYEGTLTRTRAKIELAVLKTSVAGEGSTAFLFRVSILSLRSALTFRVRCAITTGSV